ncbi:MAG: cytochrome c-type biogenesis protein CcmH [Deinococcales bacterium]
MRRRLVQPMVRLLAVTCLLAVGAPVGAAASSTVPSSPAPASATGSASGSASGTVAPAATPTSTGTSASTTPAAGSQVEISDRAYAIARQLRCPVCTAESVADSNAEIAGEMRRLIQQQLDAGKSQRQIIHYFRQRYGDWILLDPPKSGVHLVVWLLPLLALLGGAGALGLLIRRWRAAAETTPQAPPEDVARVREALRHGEDD